ncbi:MAG: T9SS type A sorting domain-containing protein [Bacteroidales bacterium]|nr:T9SS type A sorting domain-containing protein [Bacteroidales bacterium]MCF8405282.1 T9SS type A sorting domain-containing protein [Bacteroidales bacterium]
MKGILRIIHILLIVASGQTLLFSQVTKILFLGNSYTAANNLPEKVSELAHSLGDTVFFDSNTPGGYRLLDHTTNATTLSKISSTDWDFVVIQAQSQEPSVSPDQLSTEVLPYANILNDSIKSNNSCTETVFYMTWGRKYGDQQNCSTWPPVCTYLGMQQRLMAGYMTMAEQNNSTVAPVGLSWKQAMDNDTDSLINLYSSDNSHPSLAGTYLTACVMYATMFHRSPLGSEYFAGLLTSDALFLQQMAEYVVLSEDYTFTFFDTYSSINYDLSWESWFDLGNITFAGFNYSTIGATYNFFDSSINSEDWYWDFGDGFNSVLQNPTHTYTESGNYEVSQKTNNPCFEDTYSQEIEVLVTSSGIINKQQVFSIFPNPGDGNIILTFQSQMIGEDVSYEIWQMNGSFLKQGAFHLSDKNQQLQIDLTNFPAGLYVIKIYADNETLTRTFVIR